MTLHRTFNSIGATQSVPAAKAQASNKVERMHHQLRSALSSANRFVATMSSGPVFIPAFDGEKPATGVKID
jgi:hypothetical protein